MISLVKNYKEKVEEIIDLQKEESKLQKLYNEAVNEISGKVQVKTSEFESKLLEEYEPFKTKVKEQERVVKTAKEKLEEHKKNSLNKEATDEMLDFLNNKKKLLVKEEESLKELKNEQVLREKEIKKQVENFKSEQKQVEPEEEKILKVKLFKINEQIDSVTKTLKKMKVNTDRYDSDENYNFDLDKNIVLEKLNKFLKKSTGNTYVNCIIDTPLTYDYIDDRECYKAKVFLDAIAITPSKKYKTREDVIKAVENKEVILIECLSNENSFTSGSSSLDMLDNGGRIMYDIYNDNKDLNLSKSNELFPMIKLSTVKDGESIYKNLYPGIEEIFWEMVSDNFVEEKVDAVKDIEWEIKNAEEEINDKKKELLECQLQLKELKDKLSKKQVKVDEFLKAENIKIKVEEQTEVEKM